VGRGSDGAGVFRWYWNRSTDLALPLSACPLGIPSGASDLLIGTRPENLSAFFV
jgi:hypothetical protein